MQAWLSRLVGRSANLKIGESVMEDEVKSGDRASVAEAGDQLLAITEERDKLAQEKAELQDLLLRRQAEFENFRRRVERERAEFAEYAAMEAVRTILPVVDDLGRALRAAASSETADKEFVKGVELVYQRLLESLRKLGLEPIPTLDQKFDPHVHHAVEMVQNDELEDHTILEEYQAGYYFKGKLLRPSMVKVAVRP